MLAGILIISLPFDILRRDTYYRISNLARSCKKEIAMSEILCQRIFRKDFGTLLIVALAVSISIQSTSAFATDEPCAPCDTGSPQVNIAQTCSLVVECPTTPYHLYLDGSYYALVETASFPLANLRAGTHWISIQKDGYNMYSNNIEIGEPASGEAAQSLEVTLMETWSESRWIELPKDGFGLLGYEYFADDTEWCNYKKSRKPCPCIEGGLSSPSGDWFTWMELTTDADKYREAVGDEKGYATVLSNDGTLIYVPFYWLKGEDEDGIGSFCLDYSVTHTDTGREIWFHLECRTFVPEYFEDYYSEWIHGIVRLY